MRQVDLAIIGAGVAGLTAAAEAAGQGLQVLVIERMGAGGQVMNVECIDNMPGFASGISGFELGPQLQERAEEAGAEFMLDTVLRVTAGAGRHVLHCEGEDVEARAVIVAAGSSRRRLGVPGEEALLGRGVSHCASCDGPLFQGRRVCVVGGGDSGFGEALVLAGCVAHAMLVFREEAPHASPELLARVASHSNVEMLAGAEIVAIAGEGEVTGVELRDAAGAVRVLPVDGVFVYAGLQADTGFLAGTVQLDPQGRIVTDGALGSSVPGILAAGDIRSGGAYLLAAAAEDGLAAARSARRYLLG